MQAGLLSACYASQPREHEEDDCIFQLLALTTPLSSPKKNYERSE
jgi:hypothetical protein